MNITVCIVEPDSGNQVEAQLPLEREPLLCALRAGGINHDPCEIFLDGDDEVLVGLKGKDAHAILPLIRWNHTLEDLNLYAALMDALPRRFINTVEDEIHAGKIKTLDAAILRSHALAMKLAPNHELFYCPVAGYRVQNGVPCGDGRPIAPELVHEVRDMLHDLWKTHAATYPVPLGNHPVLGDSLLAVSWNVVPSRNQLEGYVECLLMDPITPEQRSVLAHWIDEQNEGAFGKLMSEHPIETDTGDLMLSWGHAAISEINEINTISRGI